VPTLRLRVEEHLLLHYTATPTLRNFASMSSNATTGTASATSPTTTTTKAETAVSYAALILADANTAITPDKLQALLKAANVDDVEPIWTTLFAKALEGKDVKDILTAVSTSAPEVGTGKPKADETDGVGEEKDMGEAIVEGGEGDDSDMEGGMFDLFG
jgi:large subunit ribosomal protein LP1